MKYISIKIFLISLAIGLFLNYMTVPTPNIIYIYPTPENYDKIQYKDDTGTCFGLKMKEVLCSNDDSEFKVPFQQAKEVPIA